MRAGSGSCCALSMSCTAAARWDSAFARTAADLSEQRCSSRARQMVPHGAGKASSPAAGTAVAAVSGMLLASVGGSAEVSETACAVAGVPADAPGVPSIGLRDGVPCVGRPASLMPSVLPLLGYSQKGCLLISKVTSVTHRRAVHPGHRRDGIGRVVRVGKAPDEGWCQLNRKQSLGNLHAHVHLVLFFARFQHGRLLCH